MFTRSTIQPLGAALWPVLGAGAALLALLLVLPARDSMIDDSYITLSYVRNLLDHGTWGLLPDDFANTATSILNVLLLACLTRALGDPVWAVVTLQVICATWILLTLHGIGAREKLAWWFAPLTLLLLLFNPLLQSTLGLETWLAICLLVASYLAATAAQSRKFGVLSALLVLARPDLAVFTGLAVVTFPAARSPWALLTAAGVSLPWYIWSWFHLGSLIPDTLLIKMQAHSWGEFTFFNGPLLYLRKFPIAFSASVVVPALGLLALLDQLAPARARSPALVTPSRTLALGGVTHYAAFSLLGVPPYHWYYGPVIAALSIFVCAGLAGRAVRPTFASRWPVALSGVVCGLAVLMSLGLTVQRGGQWTSAPIMTNWALPAEYRQLGEALGAHLPRQPIRSPGEIGTLLFHCRCLLLDEFSTRQYANRLIRQRRDAARGPLRWWLELNHRHRRLDEAAPAPRLRLVWQAAGRSGQGFAVTSPWRGNGRIVLAPVPP